MLDSEKRDLHGKSLVLQKKLPVVCYLVARSMTAGEVMRYSKRKYLN